MLLGGQTTELHIDAILPITSYTNGEGFPIQFAYRPKATPFGGEACETNCLLVRTESNWKTCETFSFHCSQPSCKFQHGTYMLRVAACMGVCQAVALKKTVPICFRALHGCPPSSGANWQRQASHKCGKKWSGWNRTNQTGGYVPALAKLYCWCVFTA